MTVLAGLFLMMVVTTILSRVTPFIILVLCLGLIGQVGWLFILSLFFGGDISSALPLLKLTLKLSVVSLASITVFSGMDPEKSATVCWRSACRPLSRSVCLTATGFCRYCSRSSAMCCSPTDCGVKRRINPAFYWRLGVYYLKLLVLSFFPLMLATAKRSRTTVEALETRGFSYGMKNPAAKKLKLSHLKLTSQDMLFLSGTAGYTALLFWVG